MHLPRRLTLAVGALALVAPTLTSCGFNLGTDRPYTPAAGTNFVDGSVKVLAATVVSSAPGSGTLVVGLNNDDPLEPVTLTEVGGGSEEQTVEVSSFDPVEIAPLGFVNLIDAEPAIAVTGDYIAGDVLPMTFTLESGDTIDLDVPVVAACDEYEGFDVADTGETGSGEAAAGDEQAYDCEFPEAVVEYGPETEPQGEVEGPGGNEGTAPDEPVETESTPTE
ncbi:copper chaperone PCu(A)C [Nocardioides kribbensis]|uniref:hypothetical protein n=1 Tax=Nocardioides kribbensis TaxID=305517 RepID=UPI00187944E2|nr:hypothetical protein [Nocardioides kribbensis]